MSHLDGSLVIHPRDVLQAVGDDLWALPVCDHYSGVEARMRKSLALQAQGLAERGFCSFDVTLDLEDGAEAGLEAEQARLVADLALASTPGARVAVRVHPTDHPAFADDVNTVVGVAGHRLCHIMLPKVESVEQINHAAEALDRAGATRLPLHVLVESPAAVSQVGAFASHPRVQSLSFGLMDFVSAHQGAIGASAMTARGQFAHPLVMQAKLRLASACHAAGKVPAHNVVTEVGDPELLSWAAMQAARQLGFTRMWSIHPQQIGPIVAAFQPEPDALASACEVLLAASAANWGPVAVSGQLQDRASYRHHWHVLKRAARAGMQIPTEVQPWLH